MNCFRHQNSSSRTTTRFICQGTLSCCRSTFFLYLLLCLLTAICSILVSSCTPEKLIEEENELDPQKELPIDNRVDLSIRLSDNILNDNKIQKLNVLIYNNDGLKELEENLELKNLQKEYKIKVEEGDKLVLVLANYPQKLKQAIIQKYESCLNLELNFKDNQELYPIMIAQLQSSNMELYIDTLTSLVSKIIISKITNNLDNYELLEAPKLRLLILNSNIKCFQSKSFYPKDYIEYGQWSYLDYDIGINPQFPNTILYCFPNSEAENGFCTQLEFVTTIYGKERSFIIDIGKIDIDDTIYIELIINDIDEYDYLIN